MMRVRFSLPAPTTQAQVRGAFPAWASGFLRLTKAALTGRTSPVLVTVVIAETTTAGMLQTLHLSVPELVARSSGAKVCDAAAPPERTRGAA